MVGKTFQESLFGLSEVHKYVVSEGRKGSKRNRIGSWDILNTEADEIEALINTIQHFLNQDKGPGAL